MVSDHGECHYRTGISIVLILVVMEYGLRLVKEDKPKVNWS